jgi:hypothetical protein
MATSPLSVYQRVFKEAGVGSEQDVDPVAKSAYLTDQISQQKQILNRLLFDRATSVYHQEQAKDDVSKNAHRQKSDGYQNDITQILSALKFNQQLLEELRDKHPVLRPEA